jgi:hypothetical protein
MEEVKCPPYDPLCHYHPTTSKKPFQNHLYSCSNYSVLVFYTDHSITSMGKNQGSDRLLTVQESLCLSPFRDVFGLWIRRLGSSGLGSCIWSGSSCCWGLNGVSAQHMSTRVSPLSPPPKKLLSQWITAPPLRPHLTLITSQQAPPQNAIARLSFHTFTISQWGLNFNTSFGGVI